MRLFFILMLLSFEASALKTITVITATGVRLTGLLDTGASYSAINQNLLYTLGPYQMGESLEVQGLGGTVWCDSLYTTFTLGGVTFESFVIVVPNTINGYDFILGFDDMKKLGMVIDFTKG